jgi:hypothetical protein
MSLLECLQQISDPRSRNRREYPLYALLAIVILAAMHGRIRCALCGCGARNVPLGGLRRAVARAV